MHETLQAQFSSGTLCTASIKLLTEVQETISRIKKETVLLVLQHGQPPELSARKSFNSKNLRQTFETNFSYMYSIFLIITHSLDLQSASNNKFNKEHHNTHENRRQVQSDIMLLIPKSQCQQQKDM